MFVVVTPQLVGTLTSAGTNAIVDPNNLINESNETNNTAQTILTTVTSGTPPTAPISGRVFTPVGLGIRNTVVRLIDDTSGGVTSSTTSSFGVYTFTNMPVGRTYTLTIQNKRFRFAPRFISLTGPLTNLDIFGLE